MRCLVVMLLLVLVGCTQPVSPPPSSPAVAPSSPSVSPTPTPTCSPMGGTSRPCSREEYQKVEEQNRLTEEAIALYRRWIKESTRLYRAGGTDKPTKEMSNILAGEALQSGLRIFQDLKAFGARATTGEVKIVTVGPESGKAVRDGVAIQSCIDGTSLRFERSGKLVRRGTLATEHLVLKPTSGGLKIWTATSEEAASCSNE